MLKKLLAILYLLLYGLPLLQSGQGIATAQEANKELTHLLYEIIRNRQSQHYAEAIDICQHALLIDPENSDVLFEMFQINAELNNHEKAFEYLKAVFKQNPENKYYKELLATYYEAFGMYDEAIKLLVELIEKDFYNDEYIQHLVSLYKATDNYSEAYKQLERLEKITGTKPDLGLEKVGLLYYLHQEKKVVPELKKLVSMYPDDTRFWVMLGMEYSAKKKYKKSNEAFLYAINKTPKNEYTIEAIQRLAYNHIILADTAKSDSLIYATLESKELPASWKLKLLESFDYDRTTSQQKVDKGFHILVQQDAENEQILTTFAKYLLLYKQDTINAVKYLYKSLEANPHQPDIWSNLMYLDSENSEQILSDALKYNPKEAYFHYRKAMILTEKGENKEALIAINTAISLVKNENREELSTYWSQKGNLQYLLGDEDEAFNSFDEALRYNPGNHLVLNNYAYFLALADKNLQKAEEMSSNAIRLMPLNATYLDTYAWVLFRRGEYTLALFYIEKAIAKEDGQAAEIYDHYGDILLQKGETQKAIQAWEQAIRLGGDSTTVIKNKILLYTHENEH